MSKAISFLFCITMFVSCARKDGTLYYVPNPDILNTGSFCDSATSQIVITDVVGMWEYPNYAPEDTYTGELWFNEGGEFDADARSTRGGKWGLVKKISKDAYKLVAEPQFDWIGYFKNGLAAVLMDGLWGFINTEGQLVIGPQFNDHGENPSQLPRWNETKQIYEDHLSNWFYRFDKGKTWVQQNGRYGIIDTTGNFVVEPKYELVLDSKTELFYKWMWFRQDEKYGIISKEGKVVFEPFTDSISDCRIVNDRCVWMKADLFWKLLDEKGNEKLTQHYNEVIIVGDNYTWVNDGYQPRVKANLGNAGKWGLVDSLGQILINPETESVEYGGYDIPIKRNGKWGYSVDGQFRREPESQFVLVGDDPIKRPVSTADTAVALSNVKKIQELIPDVSMTFGEKIMTAIGTVKNAGSEVDSAEIQNIFIAYGTSINSCYRDQQDLLHNGAVTLEVTITRNGRVIAVKVLEDRTGSDSLKNCLENKIRRIYFPRSSKTRKVIVPFAFVK